MGENLRTAIHDVLMRVTDDLGGPAGVDRFIAATSFEPAIAQHTPELLVELNATAEAAGVPRDHLLAHNLMDEHWWWSQAHGQREACSTLAIAGPPAMVGQTMDLARILDGSQVVLRHESPHHPAITVLTSAGLVGLCGMSEAGFGVCVNALTTLEHSSSGLPVAFVMRGALAQPSAQAAIEFIKNVPHASGQHYAVVGHDAEGSLVSTSLECSAFGAVASAPNGHSCAHTNHPLATQDIDPSMSPTESRSELRLSILNDQLAQVKTIGDLTDLLSVPPICVDRSDSDWFTFGAIAVELGTTPTMRYTLGPPSTEPWTAA